MSAGRRRVRPFLEGLEDRCLLSANVLQTNLVSDLQGVAAHFDPNLVNPWGIAESASTPTTPGSPFWVSDNNAGVSTLYNTQGVPQALVVSIPTPGDPTGASGAPTGTVFNIDGGAAGGFKVSGLDKNGKPITASAVFLFATEDGTIVGWNPGVDPTGKFDGPGGVSTHAVIAVDNSGNNFTEPDPAKQTGAVYKGLTIATDANGRTLLYAANFRAGTVDVFGADFKTPTPKLPAGAFTDTKLPKGYAPFDVQELGGKIYVTYALQNADKHDDVAGQGHGFVDVFNLDGTPGLAKGQVRLISRGQLDSPWGVAIAPKGFGSIGGDLLVGNFGNGLINIFDPGTGKFLGGLVDPDGEPIQIDGLWALKFGNGGNGGDANTLYFTAGLFGETHGLFGSLSAVAPGTPEGPAEQQLVTAFVDVFQQDLAKVQKDLSSGVTGATLKQDLQALQTALVQLTQAEARFARDARADAAPQHAHHSDDFLDRLFGNLDL
jgi:uncharacterized protein (TIGR03118 family)